MKIYVASSWRNERQPFVVKILRDRAHEVYDFRNPPGRAGFGWEKMNENWQNWNNTQYLEALRSDLAHDGFFSDLHGMIDADACMMVMPMREVSAPGGRVDEGNG